MGCKWDASTLKQCQHSLSLGRARAVKQLPYMTDAIYALIPWAAQLPPGIGMGVRKDGVLFYSPEVLLTWKLEDVVTGLIHEAEHILRKHPARRERMQVNKHDERAWQLSVDAELGDDLEAMRLKLLDTDVTPQRIGLPNGKLAEEYFDILRKQKQHQNVRPGSCQCGSGSGVPYPGEEAFGGPPGLSQTEREAQLEQVREATAEAIRQHGTAPMGLKRWAESELTQVKKIPWEQQLQAIARRAVAWKRGQVDLSYGRVARRQAAIGMGPGRPIVPALVAPTPRVALVQDTSGSMSSNDIAYTFKHAGEILKHCGGVLTFVSIDAAVHASFKTSSIERMKQNIIGGGGTDFRPAFELLKTSRPRPDIIVFATDGYGIYPTAEETMWCKTIWLQTCQYHGTVPFGTVLAAY